MGVSRGSLLPGNKMKETYKKNRNHIEMGVWFRNRIRVICPVLARGKRFSGLEGRTKSL